MTPKNTETLKNMNSTTAKFTSWYVRVLDPKVIDYSFRPRGEKIPAQQLQCVLVSNAADKRRRPSRASGRRVPVA